MPYDLSDITGKRLSEDPMLGLQQKCRYNAEKKHLPPLAMPAAQFRLELASQEQQF
jgi:hypothetical protein